MKSDIPDKLYFKIGEVSKIADVATHVLRYWETEFPAIRPKRSNSQRLYRRADVETVLKIKSLLYGKGYTIAGAKKFLESGEPLVQETVTPEKLDIAVCLGRIKRELLAMEKMLDHKK